MGTRAGEASDPDEPRGVVQISHGVAEHAGRYDRLAQALTAAGYAVSSHDHRGHGASISEAVALGGFGAAGWSGLVADLVALGEQLHAERPDLPLFLVGHSMGSFALQEAIQALSGARFTIARDYLEGRIDRARAVELARKYQLVSKARAEQSIAFTEQYRSYVINYGLGREMVARFVEGTGVHPADEATRWQRMERILSEPTLPSDLVVHP